MKKLILSLATILLLVCSNSLYAAIRYVDNTATGANNGTSWANAWTTFAAMDSGMVAGDTIYISGGATSQTYTDMLSSSKIATQANPITIKVGQDAGHNGIVILEGATVYGINLYNAQWITISGQLGSGTTPNMIVRNHNKDELRVAIATGIDLSYIEFGPQTHAPSPDGGECVDIQDTYIGGSNRLHHNIIHDCYNHGVVIRAIGGTPTNANYFRIDNNEIYNFGTDGIHGAIATGITIDHNNIHNSCSTATVCNQDYSDAIQSRGFQWVTIAYNIIHDIEGPNGMFGFIYLECDNTQSNVAAHDMYVYNNVMWDTIFSGADVTGGIIYACKACASITNVSILNNTIVNTKGAPLGFNPYNASSVSNVIIANNLLYDDDKYHVGGQREMVNIAYMDGTPTPTTGSFGDAPTPNIIWDYNLVAVANSDTMYGHYGAGLPAMVTYSQWKTNCHCDIHGVSISPIFVNYSAHDYHLTSGDSAKDIGIARTEFSNDYDGITRPQGSAWDIGAYEYVAIACTPSKVVFTTQPSGGYTSTIWGTQPAVSIEDAGSVTCTTATNAVTLAIGTNPGSGTLACTTNPLTPTSGVSSFSGCNINSPGTGYTLTAASSGLTGDTSSTFNILTPISRGHVSRSSITRSNVTRNKVTR